MDDVEAMLHKTLDDEKAADQKLSGLAEEYVNQKAAA
jgi:ferritin-like metal-binding protein YciE